MAVQVPFLPKPMLHDLRYALRTLGQNPGFALTAIVSIALAIGANSTIFSLADGLLFRPLPVPRASEVVTVRSRTPNGYFSGVSYADYADLRDSNRSFRGLVAYEMTPVAFAGDSHAQPQLEYGYVVSGNFFQVLEIAPQLGRGFEPREDQVPGRDAVIVLGHDFWKNQFSSDASAIGRRVRLNGIEFTIVGVAPESFTGMDLFSRPSFFVPAMMAPRLLASGSASGGGVLTNRAERVFTVKGRLQPGVSVRSADAEVSAFATVLARTYPATNRAFGAAVRTEIQTEMDTAEGNRLLVVLLSTFVLLVLGIACANVANLMLSRGRARTREIAVRIAVGAGRARLVRQLMVESLAIALLGGALGLLMVQFSVPLFSMIQIQAPGDAPSNAILQLDHRVLWFTFLISVASAVLFGLAPALRATKADLLPALKAGTSGIEGRSSRLFGRSALVIVQIAGCLVVIAAAAQMFAGTTAMLRRGTGYRVDHILIMRFDPSFAGYTPERSEQFYKTLLDRAQAVPGVKSVALTGSIPSSNSMMHGEVVPEGYRFPRGVESLGVTVEIVDGGYFGTFGIPILQGRGLFSTDRADAPRVAVVSQIFAQRYLGAHPIGKRLRLDGPNGPWTQVVGVAANTKYTFVLMPPDEMVYLPLLQHPQVRMTLLAQSYGDAAALATPLRQMVHAMDPSLAIVGVRTMQDFFEKRTMYVVYMINGIVGILGLIGLGLALVGLYAVVSYQVARKTREIGIRMALGANRRQVIAGILRQASLMGAIGVAIGLLLTPATSVLTAIFGAFGIWGFGAVAVGLLLATLIAAAIPALRAARVDPMIALRED
jgi:predicted permease